MRKESDIHLSAESRGDNEKPYAFGEGTNQIGAGDIHQQERANNTGALRREEHISSHGRLHTKRRALERRVFFTRDKRREQETAERETRIKFTGVHSQSSNLDFTFDALDHFEHSWFLQDFKTQREPTVF